MTQQVNAETLHKLVIRFLQGQEHSIVLTDKPVLTFDNDFLYVDEITTYPIGIVKDFHFTILEEEEPAQQNITIYDRVEINHDKEEDPFVEMITAPTAELEFKYVGGVVTMCGLEHPQTIHLFNIQGQNVHSEKVADDGCITIDLYTMPAGIYIVKTDLQSFKIRK